MISINPLPAVPQISPISVSGNNTGSAMLTPSVSSGISSGINTNALFNSSNPISINPPSRPALPKINVSTPTIELPSPISGVPGKTVPDPLFAAPAAPTTPTVPAPARSSIQTTPSGKVVNAATGSVLSPYAGSALQPGQVNIDTAQQPNTIGGTPPQTAPTTQAVPSLGTPGVTAGVDTNGQPLPTTPAVPNPLNSPLYTSPAYEAAVSAYKKDAQLSPAEIQAQTDLNNLQSSERSTITGIKGERIPLESQVGQEQTTANAETNQEIPLNQQLALAQAQRQAAMGADQFAAEAEANKIAGYRSLNTPVALGYGGSLVQPSTGKEITPAFGGSGTGSATDTIGSAIANGQLTSDMVTRYGIPFITSTLAKDPGYNFITQKASTAANSASLTQQQQYLDTTTRAYNTAQSTYQNLIQNMNANGINQSDVPIINQLTNKVKAGITDPGAIDAFHANVETLRQEYSQVLAKGGPRSVSTDNDAKMLIPDDITPIQMQKVADQLKKDGGNAISSGQDQIDTIKKRLGGNSGASNFGGSSSGSTTPIQTKYGTINPSL